MLILNTSSSLAFATSAHLKELCITTPASAYQSQLSSSFLQGIPLCILLSSVTAWPCCVWAQGTGFSCVFQRPECFGCEIWGPRYYIWNIIFWCTLQWSECIRRKMWARGTTCWSAQAAWVLWMWDWDMHTTLEQLDQQGSHTLPGGRSSHCTWLALVHCISQPCWCKSCRWKKALMTEK